MLSWVQKLAIIGMAVSGYALYVEHKAVSTPNYKALCDVSEQISCSAVFSSKYGHSVGMLLGDNHYLNLPNAFYGLLFYVAVFLYDVLTFIPFRHHLFFVASSGAVIFSAYLAYILYFVLEDLCLVCVSSYIVNLLLWFASFSRLGRTKGVSGPSKKKA
eukprot:GILK01006792.1.p1 GENE.GILK01006792.1~~GILK01006792.1.p1  ORF type:complete len:159 (-),score=17.28 GILK01006792.1:249-725(-)